jgi:hypothetical protein
MSEQSLIFDLVDTNGHRIMSIEATSGHEARDLFKARLQGSTVRAVGRFNVCQFCGKSINALTDYQDVSGQERIHRPDGAGGTNHVVHADRSSPRRSCSECVDRLKRGLSVGQESFAFDLA